MAFVQFSVETVREVARIAGETQLGEITLESAGARLVVKRAVAPILMAAPVATEAFVDEAETSIETAITPLSAPTLVSSPCVGVFRAAGLDIEAGTRVKAKSLLGVVESLKVPNEIHATLPGTVSGVLVADGQGVEWGQPLFEITPESETSS